MTHLFLSFSLQSAIPPLIFIVAVTAGGCGNRPTSDTRISDENQKIAARIKIELVKESGLDAAPINIQVHNGVVTLDGYLEDEAQRKKVLSVAQGIPGVQSVKDHLQIKW